MIGIRMILSYRFLYWFSVTESRRGFQKSRAAMNSVLIGRLYFNVGDESFVVNVGDGGAVGGVSPASDDAQMLFRHWQQERLIGVFEGDSLKADCLVHLFEFNLARRSGDEERTAPAQSELGLEIHRVEKPPFDLERLVGLRVRCRPST
jgi:hypothetical protein